MQNRFFTRPMLNMLMRPERWTLITSQFPCGVRPIRDRKRAAWMKKNAHRHDRVEALFVFSGEGRFGYRGKIYPSRAGTVFCFAPLEEHDQMLPVGDSATEHLLIEIYRDRYIGRFFDQSASVLEKWTRLFVPEELHLTPDAFYPHPGMDEWVPSAIRRTMLISALGLLTCALVERGFCPNALRERTRDFQREIIGAIEKHLHETAGKGASIDELARMSGYSKYHFFRMFKQYTGKTVHQYVDAARAHKAREMLDRGVPKRVVSETLGFAYSSAFTRWLRSHRVE